MLLKKLTKLQRHNLINDYYEIVKDYDIDLIKYYGHFLESLKAFLLSDKLHEQIEAYNYTNMGLIIMEQENKQYNFKPFKKFLIDIFEIMIIDKILN